MKKSRYTVSIPPEMDEMVLRLSSKTGVPAATILRGLIMLQHAELMNFETWLSMQKEGSDQMIRGVGVLENVGPDSLMEDAAAIERQNGNELLVGVKALKQTNNACTVAVIPAPEKKKNDD